MLGFLVGVVVLCVDPFALAGYIFAGTWKGYGWAVVIACAWAVVIDVMTVQMGYRLGDHWSPMTSAARLTGAVLLCSATWLVCERRRNKKNRLVAETHLPTTHIKEDNRNGRNDAEQEASQKASSGALVPK